jgi:2-C-methyl-D-erythritol 4-phosphate cytidylyltransferase
LNLWVVVPAAGIGRRFGGAVPKQYQAVAGQPVIAHSLARLLALDPAALVVVLHRDDPHWPALAVARDPRVIAVSGGEERADSVRAGVVSLAGRAAADDWVLVHDVARPCVTAADIRKLLATLVDDPVGGILAAPVSDTLKRVVDHNQIQGTEDRSHLWAAMTPQLFRFGLLQRALAEARANGANPTDEAAAVEALGLAPRVVIGRRDNIKITRPEDLAIAEAIIAYQQGEIA